MQDRTHMGNSGIVDEPMDNGTRKQKCEIRMQIPCFSLINPSIDSENFFEQPSFERVK